MVKNFLYKYQTFVQVLKLPLLMVNKNYFPVTCLHRCINIYYMVISMTLGFYALCIHNWLIGLMGRVFTNALGDLGSLSGRIIPKTLKMVLDTSLLNTQQYKVYIEGKMEQSRERSSALPYTLV